MEVGKLVAVIGDEDTVTGFLLAGVGHRNAEGANFLIVKQDTELQQIEEAFQKLTDRNDIGIILINQHIANNIRHVLKDYNATIPTVLEIPSKEHPYDPEQDYIMVRPVDRLSPVDAICIGLRRRHHLPILLSPLPVRLQIRFPAFSPRM